jgi:hypothetical protein
VQKTVTVDGLGYLAVMFDFVLWSWLYKTILSITHSEQANRVLFVSYKNSSLKY